MRFRFKRETLADSMATAISIDPTRKALLAAIHGDVDFEATTALEIAVLWYAAGDERIGWAPLYVVKGRNGIIGFTDGPISG